MDRALTVLEHLASSAVPQTALDVANGTVLNRSVVHRLLQTLLARGYVRRTEEGRYEIGAHVLVPSAAYIERSTLRRMSLPYLVSLSNEVSEGRPLVVSLAQAVGQDVIIVERVWNPAAPLTSLPSLRSRLPIARCAHGRVMLAAASDQTAKKHLGPSWTDAMRERLAEIRAADNYEKARSEVSDGVASMAVALAPVLGEAPSCIAISGPLAVLDEDDGSLTVRLRRTAQAIMRAVER